MWLSVAVWLCALSLMFVESGGEMGLSLSKNLGGGGRGAERAGCSSLVTSRESRFSVLRESRYSAGEPNGDNKAMSHREPEVSQLLPKSAAMILSRSLCSSAESSKLEFASVDTRLAMLVRRCRK